MALACRGRRDGMEAERRKGEKGVGEGKKCRKRGTAGGMRGGGRRRKFKK
jgi:hypothetical protein